MGIDNMYKQEAENLGIELVKVNKFGKIRCFLHRLRDGEVWFRWNGKTHRTEGYFFDSDYIYNVAIKAVEELQEKEKLNKLMGKLDAVHAKDGGKE